MISLRNVSSNLFDYCHFMEKLVVEKVKSVSPQNVRTFGSVEHCNTHKPGSFLHLLLCV
jgi:hypothetical protein